ncbi:hypothetical protein HPB48_016542 [Haemaphysalis longicornis]|uniref:Organic cation/carnitine transporter n=1 Tax=Haemaphysalis longicornis TaxID=44386 RepID=A0A9J6G3E8_HAELO|nr:hypothetical protein HPB48_016542 [Haemaphysalis longicornis]
MVVFSTAIGCCSFLLQHRSFKITFAVMDHWCRRPASFANFSVEEWMWLAIPRDDQNEHSRCLVRHPPGGGYRSHVVACSSWEFDLTPYGPNAVSEWNLVCDRAWLLSLVKVVYSTICIVALMVAGTAADHIGRRTVILLTIPAVLIAGVASTRPEGFYFFVAVRSIVSAATSALLPPLFVLLYEVSPTHKFAIYQSLVALACIILIPATLLLAALGRTGWASYQIKLLAPTFPTFFLFCAVDESPAWLMARGFVSDAERVCSRAARINNIRLAHSYEQATLQHPRPWERAEREERNWLCAPRYLVRTIFICYMSVVITFVFFAFVLNETIQTNLRTKLVSIVLSAVVVVSVLLYLPFFGPKRVVVVSGLLLSSASIGLAGTYTPEETLSRDVFFVVMRVSVIVAMAVLFVLILGLYSVTARGTAYGVGMSCLIVGDMIAQTIPSREHFKKLLLAGTALATALSVAAAEYLPEEMEGPAQHRKSFADTRSSALIAAYSMRSMQETLEPLPKGPVKARSSRTPLSSNIKSRKSRSR